LDKKEIQLMKNKKIKKFAIAWCDNGDFIDGVVILWRPNLPIPNLPNLSIRISGMHYTPKAMVCQL